jgi:hypothetical protein
MVSLITLAWQVMMHNRARGKYLGRGVEKRITAPTYLQRAIHPGPLKQKE